MGQTVSSENHKFLWKEDYEAKSAEQFKKKKTTYRTEETFIWEMMRHTNIEMARKDWSLYES